ncbi:unnamed protein product [Soboliphyme baturini]|uniref:PPM-type phosphatase domain-containing protein n=1 Tax=Soboliphyme baturini TaxID=241478 RepID=A0A183ITC4_9BILA|nr:unnamed protein product [Soboliphyme baturini]
MVITVLEGNHIFGSFWSFIGCPLKATQQTRHGADYTCLQMETIPEEVFFTGNDPVYHLNLKRNCLTERQAHSNKYFIGFLDDLPLLNSLRVLNLSDNDLLRVPTSIFKLPHLTELSLAGNKIRELPLQIGLLVNLKVLNLQNNWLESLPEELSKCESLSSLDVSFNRFRIIPTVLTVMPSIEDWLFSGNAISHIRLMILFDGPVHVRRIELRHNKLLSLPSDATAFGLLHNLTHLDISDNSAITSLELSYLTNCMEMLPDWVCRCVKVEKIVASHNRLSALPECLFTSLPCLKYLELDHNSITILPDGIENCYIEVLLLHRNLISSLPEEFFASLHRLKFLNLSYNALSFLPSASPLVELNKITQLHLCNNSLTDDAIVTIGNFRRLRVLDLSYNYLTSLQNGYLDKLQNLEHLSVSGNSLSTLPSAICSLPNLTVFRAHSNRIKEVPNFSRNRCLKVLDLACNQLDEVQLRFLVSPKLRVLDISCNENLQINPEHVQLLHPEKFVSLIDVNKEIQPDVSDDVSLPWKIGFVETPGERNKRCSFASSWDDALFGIVDGGTNSELSSLMKQSLPTAIQAEQKTSKHGDGPYLKNAFLACHKDLKALGQKLGVSCAVCHLVTDLQRSVCEVRVANCGLTEAVLCRNGEPVILTRKFSASHMPEEYGRIRQAGAILTENNDINGVTANSRLIGKYYLYPAIIPVPHEAVFKLNTLDEFMVIANRSFWETVDEAETVELIRKVQDPVKAAKCLQDAAQAYGHNGNLSIIVIRFMFKTRRRVFSPYLQRTPLRVAQRAPASSLTNLTATENCLFSDDEIKSEPRSRQFVETPNYYLQYKKKQEAALKDNLSTAELWENFSSESTISTEPVSSLSRRPADDDGYFSNKTSFFAYASNKPLPVHVQGDGSLQGTRPSRDLVTLTSTHSMSRTETVSKHD